jgi:cobalt/nickel transport system ATP-binding protein
VEDAVSEPVVRVSCVRHTYPDRTQVHLCGLDFVVEKNQRVVILGPNGSGKSTLLFHILGLLEPQEGEIWVFGVNPARHFSKIRERVGVLFQNVEEQIIAPTVWDDVSYSPRSYGHTEGEVEGMVTAALQCVGIEHLRHKVCHHLSGGERRKVALAGALVLSPELLVLDEPFEGLDPASRSDLCDLLNRLHAERGVTLVMATHDVNVVPAMADQVFVLLRGGEIVASGTPAAVFHDPGMLRRSNIEPPVLTDLFQRLADLGHEFGRPLDIETAARVLAERLAASAVAKEPGPAPPSASPPGPAAPNVPAAASDAAAPAATPASLPMPSARASATRPGSPAPAPAASSPPAAPPGPATPASAPAKPAKPTALELPLGPAPGGPREP